MLIFSSPQPSGPLRVPRSISIACAISVALSFAPAASAQDARLATVAHGSGQRDLALKLDGDVVRALACDPGKPCDPAGATALRPPESVRAAVNTASIKTVELEGGKNVGVVLVKAPAGRHYAIVVASPDAKSDAPNILYSGYVGRDGDASTELAIATGAKGKSTVKIVERASLCGTQVLTSSRALDPNKLVFRSEAVPDPVGAGRSSAVPIAAAIDATPRPRHRILYVRSASSGRASAIADGDSKTAWVPDETPRPFVSLSAPQDVPILGFDIALEPPAEGAQAPKTLALVTDAGVFNVAIPKDAAEKKATAFAVTLPQAIRTKCVAVVIDELTGPTKEAKKAEAKRRGFVSEIAARTGVDGQTLEELAKGVGSSGPNAALAEKIVAAEGTRGIRALAAAYSALDSQGRDRARRLVDATDCEDKLLLYVPLLTSVDREESDRARDRIRRCGKEAGPALIAHLMAASLDEVRGMYAEEAALVAPELSTPTLVKLLIAAKDKPEERRAIRRALAKGALRAAGIRAIDAALSDASFAAAPMISKIDVLRALGAGIRDTKKGSEVFGTVASTTEFREQYLLLGPASELARGDDAGAIAFVEMTLAKASDPRLRARAAELAGGIAKLRPMLFSAVDDEKVRVREAALLALTTGDNKVDAALGAKLVERLEGDPWTFVRLAAASAVANAPKAKALDDRIAKAVDLEEQPSVRAEMIRALGARGAQVPVLRERAFDPKEALSVRLRAIESLGAVCDRAATNDLTTTALKGRVPLFEADRKLAAAAVSALVRLQPKDLKERLAPLVAKGAAPDMSDITSRALKTPPANACK